MFRIDAITAQQARQSPLRAIGDPDPDGISIGRAPTKRQAGCHFVFGGTPTKKEGSIE
jgi:hypothetical protein